MKIYVILESGKYDSGDYYTDVDDIGFLKEEDAKAEVEHLKKNPRNHKRGPPLYDYKEIEIK